jgi:steroid 5-alpha reductase family enzyme
VFNFFFISLYQNAILLLITLPALTALEHQGSFGVADVVVAVIFAGFLLGETVADQQQWVFHREKHAGRASTRFLQDGLFRYSRHPNFFFEQAQWWAVAAFGVVAGGPQWTVVGAVLLTLLFVGSTKFTESITKSRYPEYADYQRRVSAVVPWPPKREPVRG